MRRRRREAKRRNNYVSSVISSKVKTKLWESESMCDSIIINKAGMSIRAPEKLVVCRGEESKELA